MEPIDDRPDSTPTPDMVYHWDVDFVELEIFNACNQATTMRSYQFALVEIKGASPEKRRLQFSQQCGIKSGVINERIHCRDKGCQISFVMKNCSS